MDLKFIFLLFTALRMQFPSTESAKILALYTTPGKSHLIIDMAITKALLDRGHNITVVTTLELNDPNPQYRHIKLPGHDFHSIMATMLNKSSFKKFLSVFSVFDKMMDNSKVALQSPEMKDLMNKESFDLVLLDYFINEFEIGVAAHFKCPTILIWMLPITLPIVNRLIGNPDQIGYVQNMIWSVKSNMDFFDRLKNTLCSAVDYAFWYHIRAKFYKYYEDLFPSEKYPSYDETLKNVSLIFCNHHFSQGPIRANVPAFIEIGGIQIDEKPEKLPEDIKKHLDKGTKDGAIYFSLGSNAQSSDLNKNTTDILFNVLSKLKQQVIWKWETEEVPGISDNILYKKWFPQNSVLDHPNIKLFITHGGGGSVLESEYFGVPMLGLPLFGDQMTNVKTFVSQGYGLSLDYQSLIEKELMEAITKIISNSMYRENIKNFRYLFRDRPMTAKETVIYWVEYVLRHNGAKHMQSPAVHMSQYQLWGLDVLAFIGIVLYLVFRIVKFILKFLWRKLKNYFSRNSTKSVKRKEKKAKSKPKKE